METQTERAGREGRKKIHSHGKLRRRWCRVETVYVHTYAYSAAVYVHLRRMLVGIRPRVPCEEKGIYFICICYIYEYVY
jgi:hypothetical protein